MSEVEVAKLQQVIVQEHDSKDGSNNASVKLGRVNGKNSGHKSGATPIPKKLHNEIMEILQDNRDKGAIREKRVGNRTIDIRETIVLGFFSDLIYLKYKIQTVYSLKQKHLEAVFNFLEKVRQAPATIQNKISIMRTFCGWIGKPGMVRDSHLYVKDKSSVRRSSVAQEDKSWSGNCIDVLALINKVTATDAMVGIMLELCFAFGLRRNEAIMLRPSVSTDGSYMWIRAGTKGDRPRVIVIENGVQADVVLRAIGMEDGKSKRLGERGKTLAQKVSRFKYVMKKCGITLAAEGVTVHGLRHQYMQESFESMTGEKAPIRGGDLSNIQKDKLLLAMQKLMERAGHTRVDIGAAYYGSRRRRVRKDAVISVENEVSTDLARSGDA